MSPLHGLRSAPPASAAAPSGFAQAVGGTTGPAIFGLLHGVSPGVGHGWTRPFGFLAAVLVLMLLAGRICASPSTVDDDPVSRHARRRAPVTADTLER